MRLTSLYIIIILLFVLSNVHAGDVSRRGTGAKTKNGYKSHDFSISSRHANRALVNKGYYVRTYEEVKFINGRRVVLTRFGVSMPCFFTEQGNSPCDRGSLKKEGSGRVMRYRTWSKMRDFRVRGRDILKREPFRRVK